MSQQTRIEGLDLIRGIAITLVMVRHGWSAEVGGAGIVGVVMFFALSGYLITGVLAEQIERSGRVDLRAFYRARAIRLLPAMVLMLTCFSAVVLLLDPGGDKDRLPLSLVLALTYTSDVPALMTEASLALGHLWTLAVEEQFYLAWPLLLMVWYGRTHRGPRLVALLLSLYAFLVLTMLSVDRASDAYALPTSWAVVLLLGAGARLYQHKVGELLPDGGKVRTTSSAIALSILLAIAFAPALKNWPVTYLLLGPLIGACTVVLIFHLREWTRVTTGLRPLLWLGTVSYAAYLWNNVLVIWLGGPEMRMTWWESLLSIVLTLLAAQISLVTVERRARRWSSTSRAEPATRDESAGRSVPAPSVRTRRPCGPPILTRSSHPEASWPNRE